MNCPSCNKIANIFDSRNNFYRCKYCGSEFRQNHEFLIKRAPLDCPSCESQTAMYIYEAEVYLAPKKIPFAYPPLTNNLLLIFPTAIHGSAKLSHKDTVPF